MTKRIGDKDEAQPPAKKAPAANPHKKVSEQSDADKAKAKDSSKKSTKK